jgi:hypothetical protein
VGCDGTMKRNECVKEYKNSYSRTCGCSPYRILFLDLNLGNGESGVTVAEEIRKFEEEN